MEGAVLQLEVAVEGVVLQLVVMVEGGWQGKVEKGEEEVHDWLVVQLLHCVVGVGVGVEVLQ